MNRKETFFDYKNKIFTTSQKSYFSKGDNPCFWTKNVIFSFICLLVNMRLEIMLHKISDTKETIFGFKNKIFQPLKNGIFPKGLTHSFGQKMQIFSQLFFR